MVFKRRDKPPLLLRVREVVLPQRGWGRAIEYLGHRVRRLPDSPHRIAFGLAIGVFASFSPFFGAHLLLAAGLAKLLRANITDIVFTERKPDFFRMVVDVEVRDMEHLTHVLTAIDADSDVAQVHRYRGGPPVSASASRPA